MSAGEGAVFLVPPPPSDKTGNLITTPYTIRFTVFPAPNKAIIVDPKAKQEEVCSDPRSLTFPGARRKTRFFPYSFFCHWRLPGGDPIL